VIYYLIRKLIRSLEPLIRKLGAIYSPFSRKKLTSEDWDQFQCILQPGDLILTATRGELSNFIIPGFWKHGAIYIPEKGGYVIHAVGKEGVSEMDLEPFFFKRDYVAIVRPKGMSEESRAKICVAAKKNLGLSYDFSASLENATLYCFENLFVCHAEALGRLPFMPDKVFGEPALVGDDFYKRRNVYNVVWVSEQARSWLEGDK
jgi:hypothetical protein